MFKMNGPALLAQSAQWFHRFTVEQYHQMIDAVILGKYDRVELLEGYIVRKPVHTPRHACTVGLVFSALNDVASGDWIIRVGSSVTLSDSEPEPDVVVARGEPRSYCTRHPGPDDVQLIVEVADFSLDRDQIDKARIYARAGIAAYWIANLSETRIEVHSEPSGPTDTPSYSQRRIYRVGELVPFHFDGKLIANIPVQEVIP